jgi:2-hydroxychromene-2-carboxylate isomerase
MERVEFYYDLVSPYSYLVHGQIERVCEEHGAELVLRPMLLGAVHKASGNRAPIETPAKARYQARDIQRWAERYGLPMRFPDPFPFRTLKTMRAAMWCAERGDLEPFTREAFTLYWEEGGAPKGVEEADETGPLSEVARRIGHDPRRASRRCSDGRGQDGPEERDRASGRARRLWGTGLFPRRRDVLGQRPALFRRGGAFAGRGTRVNPFSSAPISRCARAVPARLHTPAFRANRAPPTAPRRVPSSGNGFLAVTGGLGRARRGRRGGGQGRGR